MKQRGDTPGKVKHFRLSAEESSVVEQARLVNRQSFSEFVRDAALTAAEDCLEIKRRRGRIRVMTPTGLS